MTIPCTLQDALTTVYKHVRANGFQPSYETGGDWGALFNCMYRSPEGCACFIGMLIPDPVYDPDMEGEPPHRLVKKWPAMADVLALNPDDYDSREAWSDFQLVHDRLVEEMEEGRPVDTRMALDGLEAFARDHDLTIPK